MDANPIREPTLCQGDNPHWINVAGSGRYKRRVLDPPRTDGVHEYEYDPPEPVTP